jgi:hypothetical protein
VVMTPSSREFLRAPGREFSFPVLPVSPALQGDLPGHNDAHHVGGRLFTRIPLRRYAWGSSDYTSPTRHLEAGAWGLGTLLGGVPAPGCVRGPIWLARACSERSGSARPRYRPSAPILLLLPSRDQGGVPCASSWGLPPSQLGAAQGRSA